MADNLKPELVWIEGRCYRINEPMINARFQEHDLYENDPGSQDLQITEDDSGEENFEVTLLDNGRFSTTFHISKHYFGSIIGKKAMMKRKIENDTGTEIRIPKPGQEGDIVVVGSSAANVRAARRKINMVVMSTRARERPTHFVSIPLNSPNITTAFSKFKEEILEEKCDRGIEEAMFPVEAKLHLTICVMCLMDQEERELACNILKEAEKKIILPALACGPLQIRIEGVSFMREDPREVSVLYGLIDPKHPHTPRLQNLADQVYQYFYSAGFAKQYRDRNTVKLHMTVINSRYANKDEDGTISGQRKNFDATRILQKYADYEFGAQELKEIHLSQMHSTKTPDEYYPATCVVSCTGADI